jgi:uncharacterized protein (TIGR03083 family)
VDIWEQIITIRESFADRAESFTEAQWDTPSLCASWRVRDVAAHTIVPEKFSLVRGLPQMLRAGFNLNRMLAEDAVRRGSAPIPELLVAYREGIPRQSLPPGRTALNLLTDLVIHCQDMFRPLGLTYPYPSEVLLSVADTIYNDRGLGGPTRTAGLRLTALDIDWSVGDGPEVTGPAEALVLATAGRSVVLSDLAGPGLSLLLAVCADLPRDLHRSDRRGSRHGPRPRRLASIPAGGGWAEMPLRRVEGKALPWKQRQWRKVDRNRDWRRCPFLQLGCCSKWIRLRLSGASPHCESRLGRSPVAGT